MMKNNKRPLEALKVLGGYYYHCQGYDDHARDSMDYKIVEEALKALEIIKRKNVDIAYLKTLLLADKNFDILKCYNSRFISPCNRLTKEEYDLLKEWLK